MIIITQPQLDFATNLVTWADNEVNLFICVQVKAPCLHLKPVITVTIFFVTVEIV